MVHIHAIFPSNDHVIKLLLRYKKRICDIVSQRTGYPRRLVTLIPDMVPAPMIELSENMITIEFVINVGAMCVGKEVTVGSQIEQDLARLDGLRALKFGIWLRVFGENERLTHVPKK